MRLCRQVLAVAIIFLATPSVAEPSYGGRLLEHVQNLPNDLETSTRPVILASNETKPQEPDADIFALMSGKCSTLKIAGRDFACRAVAFFHSEQGRTNFTIALDDPTDDSHVISFSGENARREQDNLYELPIDRMLLNSKDRPKVDGLPVPLVELSAGICKQLGNFATREISSISCTATDKNGKKYELQFESDGSPMTVRRVRQYSLTAVTDSGKAPCQANRATRMPLQGRCCEGFAQRSDCFHPWVPGREQRKPHAGRGSVKPSRQIRDL